MRAKQITCYIQRGRAEAALRFALARRLWRTLGV
jgi:hypothetical protein